MNRSELLSKIKNEDIEYDVLVIGGGATGLGVALDAASRGLKTILFEKGDFSSQTSSMSTKIVHGGVRYLKTLDFKRLFESAEEQCILKKQAPHLVTDLEFILPVKNYFQFLFFRIGFSIFDFVSKIYSKKYKLPTKSVRGESVSKILESSPKLIKSNLSYGICYSDSMFDDARFALNLVLKTFEFGGQLLNYCKVRKLNYADFKVSGVEVIDLETSEVFNVKSKIVVNATGPESDFILNLDQPNIPQIIDPLQGTHIVLPLKFLESTKGIIIPRTKRNRVFCAMPWMNVLLIGTTETRLSDWETNPEIRARKNEIEYLLDEFSLHFSTSPKTSDILSVFSGVRPLLNSDDKEQFASRDHAIFTSPSGLITIAGGKWTTYRLMAKDVVNMVMERISIIKIPAKTSEISFCEESDLKYSESHLRHYGTFAKEIEILEQNNPKLKVPLHPELPYNYSSVFWAIKHEYAIHLEDILIRRTRSLLLNSKATLEIAPEVANFMATEMNQTQEWVKQEVENFQKISEKFLASNAL